MTDDAKPLSWRLYEHALPLTDALESFAPPQVKEQFGVLDFGNALVKYPDRFWRRQRARLHNYAGLLSALLPASLQFPAGGENLRRQQRAQLYRLELNYIHGLPRYVLLGFVTPRQVDASPVAIPLDCWDGDIDWNRQSLHAGSLSFEGLRVANLVALPSSLTAEWLDSEATRARAANGTPTSPEKSPASRPGRKSAQAQVCQAVDQLFPNSEFRNAQQKVQLDMVLAQIRGQDPVLDAFLAKSSDKTLKGHIARRIRELEGLGAATGSTP